MEKTQVRTHEDNSPLQTLTKLNQLPNQHIHYIHNNKITVIFCFVLLLSLCEEKRAHSVTSTNIYFDSK